MAIDSSKYAALYEPHKLVSKEWNLVAEFESVMESMNLLSLQSQIESVGEIAFSWLSFEICKYGMTDMKEYMVIDTKEVYNSRVARNDLPMMEVPKHLLCEETKDFMKRLVFELNEYFPFPDGDQRLAMLLHSLMQWNGIKYVTFTLYSFLCLKQLFAVAQNNSSRSTHPSILSFCH